MTTTKLTRGEVLRIVSKARAEGKHPDLTYANLTDANLRSADLRYANLTGANLRSADLTFADLSGTNLHGADLTRADLSGADLYSTDLTRANLHGAIWDGLVLDGLHRYRCLLIPTPGGWVTRIGCWSGTVSGLRELIAGDDWPESGEEARERLRPLLRLWCDLAEANADSRPRVIPDLAKRWGEA